MTPAELRQRRQSLGMSQAVLAAALGITENRYQAWETGRNGIPPFLHLALDMLATKGPRNRYASKLTESEAQSILDARGERSCIDLAEQFHVSAAAISLIQRRKTWTHLRPSAPDDVDGADRTRRTRYRPRVKGNKLTQDEAREILAAKAGHTRRTVRALATRYHVSIVTIRNIWSGATWSHLQPPKTEE